MFVYTTTSYPTYSSPVLYPLSHYTVAPSVPTTRERYLRALAEAQSAHARYLSELEEQRTIAGLRLQEALIFATRNDITRRRVEPIYAEVPCRRVASLQGRRQAYVRPQKAAFFSPHEPQDPMSDLEAIISALHPDGGAEDYLTKRENERVHDEKARNVDALNVRARFIRKLEHALEAAHADHSSHSSQPLKPSSKTTPADPSQVPLSRWAEISRNRLVRERAARTIQQRWRSHSSDAAARNDAVATITTLRARFQFLRDTFSFPEHLEFGEHAADQKEEVPTLLFSPANAAVHAYTHELTKLLTLADSVPSHGSHRVREERRSFVRLVNEALDSVDRRVAKVWEDKIKYSAIMRSGTDAVETPSVVPLNVVQFGSESVARSSKLDISVQRINSTTNDSESLASTSTDASTIIPSHVTTDVHPPTFNNIQTSEVLTQDMPSLAVLSEQEVPTCLPSPEEALNIQRDVMTRGSSHEDQDDVAVQTKLKTVDSIEELRDLDVANSSSSSSTPSQSQSSEASQVSTEENTEITGVDVLSPFEGIVDLTSGSPVPDLTTAQSFDVVYPDSPPLSPLGIGNDAGIRAPTQSPSFVSIEEDMTPRVRETGNEAQNRSNQEAEEEAFELL